MIEVEWARDPYFPTISNDKINLTVKFAHLGEPVVFTAFVNDVMAHGAEIHARALAGEFGTVTPYTTPSTLEQAQRENPPLRASKMVAAVDSATHWDMMGDASQATAWRSYYRELYALEQAPGWPLVEQWPTPPEVSLSA